MALKITADNAAGSFTFHAWKDDKGERTNIKKEVYFQEDLDSVELNVDADGITGTRVVTVNWGDVWHLIQAIGTTNVVTGRQTSPLTWPQQTDWDRLYQEASFWEKYPGKQRDNSKEVPSIINHFGNELRIVSARIDPKWEGKQPGVTTETNGLAKYQVARVILEYATTVHPKLMNEIQMGLGNIYTKGGRKFEDGNEVLAGVNIVESVEEVTSYIRTQEILDYAEKTGTGFEASNYAASGVGDDIDISNLNAPTQAKGKVNATQIQLYFGRHYKLFDARMLLFSSMEMRHTHYMGKFGMDLVYRFQVSPAYTLSGDGTESDPVIATPRGWDYLWDDETKTYKELASDSYVYDDYEFLRIFPTSWGVKN